MSMMLSFVRRARRFWRARCLRRRCRLEVRESVGICFGTELQDGAPPLSAVP
jgi:hypothetical protein